MKLTDMELDGWTLDDGVELHREFPATFWIPAIWRRYLLRRNQLVKLIFRIGLRDDQGEESVEVERMWVIVTRRSGWGRYEGVLDNDPVCTKGMAAGLALAFEARHVIQIYKTPAASKSP